MPSSALDIVLTPEARPGRHILASADVSYPIDLRPETDVMLDDFLRRLRVVLTGRPDPSHQLTPSEILRAVGTRLWQAIMPETAPTEAREQLKRSLLVNTTVVRLTLPNSLAVLPWELLCDPEQSGDTAFISRRRPFVRIVPGDGEQLPMSPSLRVLLLIAAPPEAAEDHRIDVASERAAVEQATRPWREAGLLHLLVEDIVTPRRVQQVLLRFKPDIVHYVGHGGYADGIGGFVEWEDEQGRPALISDARLADLLRPRGLRAVFLHGCETATSERYADFSGVAGALIGAGIPAVLAQQGKLTYESSQRASEMCYEALASGLGLAEVTFEVRLALAQAERPDWVVPILYARTEGLAALLNPAAPPAVADPLLTLSGAAADLPAPTGVFVGRQRELRALRVMLEHAPGSGPVLALISGPGGIGKSTLAAQAVVRYGHGYRAVLTLSCRGYQGFDLFLQQIGTFLKRHGAPALLDSVLPDPQLDRLDKIRSTVDELNRAGSFVLVIDNLESVQAEDRSLADADLLQLLQQFLMSLRGGRVLITGRYALEGLTPDGKFQSSLITLNLDDLSAYEIRQLLVRQPQLAHLGDQVIDELVHEFGGLPYVYDLLSSQAASQDLGGLIYDIQQRKTRERQERSSEEWSRVRRQVIESVALEATIKRLPDSARQLLAQLSVFQRPFPLEAMEQGLTAQRKDWLPLINWALLRYDQVEREYRLHSLTAHYAADLLDNDERVTTQLRVGEWYQTYAAISGNLSDMLEAHRLFNTAGEGQRAGELANGLLEVLSRFGLYQTWRDLCLTTLRSSEGTIAAEARRQLGMIAQAQGQYEEARKLYGESLSVFERLGDQRGRASTLYQLGNIPHMQGQYEEARKLYGESLSVFERLGDQRGICHRLRFFRFCQAMCRMGDFAL